MANLVPATAIQIVPHNLMLRLSALNKHVHSKTNPLPFPCATRHHDPTHLTLSSLQRSIRWMSVEGECS